MLAWYRELIALRRDLRGSVELLDAGPGVVSFRRGEHVVALNFADDAPTAAAGGRSGPRDPGVKSG